MFIRLHGSGMVTVFPEGTFSFFGFIQPMAPTFPVPLKLEQKLLLVATVGDVPDAAWNMVSICSGHKNQLLVALFP